MAREIRLQRTAVKNGQSDTTERDVSLLYLGVLRTATNVVSPSLIAVRRAINMDSSLAHDRLVRCHQICWRYIASQAHINSIQQKKNTCPGRDPSPSGTDCGTSSRHQVQQWKRSTMWIGKIPIRQSSTPSNHTSYKFAKRVGVCKQFFAFSTNVSNSSQ